MPRTLTIRLCQIVMFFGALYLFAESVLLSAAAEFLPAATLIAGAAALFLSILIAERRLCAR